MLKEILQAERKQGEAEASIFPRTEAWRCVGNGTVISPPHPPCFKKTSLKRSTFIHNVALVVFYL